MILLILLLVFVFTVVGFYIDVLLSKPKMHPAGYIMVPKKELKRREELAMRDTEYESQLSAWREGRDYTYSEAQQYQRELLEYQLQQLQDMQNDTFRIQEELSNERALREFNADRNNALDIICNGILDLFK